MFFTFNYKLFYLRITYNYVTSIRNYTCLISIQKIKKHKYLYKILYS